MMLPLTAALLFALALSALLTSAEHATFAIGEARARALAEEGRRGGTALARLRARPRRLLILLRLGNVIAVAASAGLAAYVGNAVAGGAGAAGSVAAAVVAILLVGELAPMRWAATRSVGIALAVAPPLLLATRLLSPVLALLESAVRPAVVEPAATDETLRALEFQRLAALGHLDGPIEEHERQLIERAVRLDETRAWNIMVPRVDIFAWPDSLTLAAIAPRLGTVPYSRVPVYGESIDDITGVLYLRDAYQALVAGQRDVPLRALAREPLTVPGSISLTKLLREFQTRRIHLAVVVDEYGGTDGLVTLEDVLEELVGEIVDETDVAEDPIVRVSRTEVIAAGDADLREINHIFNTSFPQLEHRSLNGYLLEELGRVPSTGERLERDGIAIEVLEATETQVVRARLRRVTPPEGAPGAGSAAGDSGGGRMERGGSAAGRPEGGEPAGRLPGRLA